MCVSNVMQDGRDEIKPNNVQPEELCASAYKGILNDKWTANGQKICHFQSNVVFWGKLK